MGALPGRSRGRPPPAMRLFSTGKARPLTPSKLRARPRGRLRLRCGDRSVLNEDAQVEMDAVIMDGRTLRAGSVAAVQNVRNPVSLARLVMEKTDHVLLVGAGANKFAAKQGIVEVLPEELVTAEAREQFEAIQQYQPGVDWLFRQQQQAHDTVGAVAMDAGA